MGCSPSQPRCGPGAGEALGPTPLLLARSATAPTLALQDLPSRRGREASRRPKPSQGKVAAHGGGGGLAGAWPQCERAGDGRLSTPLWIAGRHKISPRGNGVGGGHLFRVRAVRTSLAETGSIYLAPLFRVGLLSPTLKSGSVLFSLPPPALGRTPSVK